MPTSDKPTCLARRCGRRTAPDQLLCERCFRRHDRVQRAGYSALTRYADDELQGEELERIHRAAFHAAAMKTPGGTGTPRTATT